MTGPKPKPKPSPKDSPLSLRRPRAARHQTGYIYEKSGAFYLRFYAKELRSGVLTSVQRHHRLCAKDNRHFSTTCKAVKSLRDEFMRTINVQTTTVDMPVTDFWDERYLPFAEENLKPSTVNGYTQIWSQHLKSHFTGQTLQGYRPHHASAFLLTLTRSQGRRTLNHIRSLMSGVFSHALNLGLVSANPITGVRILGRVTPPKQTPHYTLEEAENIISALVNDPMCQAIVALSFFAALRPGEISGLQWGDIDFPSEGGETGAVHIRRACVRGVIGTPKTPESIATLPLLPQALVPLMLWKAKCPGSPEGWCFPNERGNPADLKDVVRRHIRPVLKLKGLEWKGLYAGRRGAATAVIGLTDSVAAAQELLRHKNMSTTLQFYKKMTQNALTTGLKALGAAANANVDGNDGGTDGNGGEA